MNTAYLITGSNIGNRAAQLKLAVEKIAAIGCTIIATSAVYETDAWGVNNQDAYYNQVLKITTDFEAPELMERLLAVETAMGRVRKEKYSARNIDIDILLFNNDIIHQEQVTIPHPRMQDRRFVLTPLAALAPGLVHPVFHKTIAALLAACEDPLQAIAVAPGS